MYLSPALREMKEAMNRPRKLKWYRSDKSYTRPFSHRIWFGCKPMRGGRHLCKSAERALWNGGLGERRWGSWKKMFEPVRVNEKRWQKHRAVPFWTNKP